MVLPLNMSIAFTNWSWVHVSVVSFRLFFEINKCRLTCTPSGLDNSFLNLACIIEWINRTSLINRVNWIISSPSIIVLKFHYSIIEGLHQILFFLFWVVEIIWSCVWHPTISVVKVTTLDNGFTSFFFWIAVEFSNLDFSYFCEVCASVKHFVFVKSIVIDLMSLILDKVSSTWANAKICVLLDYVDAFMVVVVVIGLSNHRLFRISLYQMIRTIGNLLILKLKLHVFRIACVIVL